MRRTWHRHGPLILLVLTIGGILYARFARVFACPSCFLFNNEGDGLKNYFTTAWFVKHDTGWWFNGMNYPYGEHPVYTDMQPAWAGLLKLIDQVVPVHGHVIGTVNMLMILSLVVAAILIYYILRSFHLPRWYAALLAVPITLLSPQIERFNGHYSLAHCWYIPLLILLLIRWARAERPFWPSIGMMAAIVWMGFTHLYFLFIAAALLACYAITRWLLYRFRIDRQVWGALAIMLISCTIVYGTVKLTDPVADRPQDVYGLYVFNARAEGTFLPWYEPVASFLREGLKIKKPDVEGLSYVGIAGTLLLPAVLIWLIVVAIRRRSRIIASRRHAEPIVLFGTAIGVWLIASGWLYMLVGGLLVEVLPVLGQFRSLGRLAWLFYYLLLLTIAYWAYLAVRMTRTRWKRVALIAVFSLLGLASTVEGIHHLWQSSSGVFRTNTHFKGSEPYRDLVNARYGDDHFQAILQVPLYGAGAEKFSLPRGHWQMRDGMQCAWETGLPIVEGYLSRTSVSQALEVLQLLSRAGIDKTRLDRMDQRPLLLLAGPEHLVPAEEVLISAATPIGQVETMRLLELPVAALRTLPPDSLYQPDTVLFAELFDDDQADTALRGGALYNTELTELVALQDTARAGELWWFSIWALVTAESPGFPVIRHRILNAEGTEVYSQQHSQFTYEPVNVDGPWVEVRLPIRMRGDRHRHIFELESTGIYVDELKVFK
ncbi:MAG: hypothetical protein R3301_13725 [Saprospiraceae bacterium]|nr:hypothetical protein [Saprospiraceae bacterium]